MADLIERLRARQESRYDGGSQDHGWYADDLCQEAADEIERLTADRDNLEQSFVDVCAELGCEHDNEAALMAVHSLTSELSAARALLAQYEQAPVVGWRYRKQVIGDDGTPVYWTAWSLSQIDPRLTAPDIGQYIPLIARPESQT